MLQARIHLIQTSVYYNINTTIVRFRQTLENYIVPLFEDYFKNKDKDLKLLDQSASSHGVTIFLQNTMNICLFASLGSLVISNFFKF